MARLLGVVASERSLKEYRFTSVWTIFRVCLKTYRSRCICKKQCIAKNPQWDPMGWHTTVEIRALYEGELGKIRPFFKRPPPPAAALPLRRKGSTYCPLRLFWAHAKPIENQHRTGVVGQDLLWRFTSTWEFFNLQSWIYTHLISSINDNQDGVNQKQRTSWQGTSHQE